MVGFMPDSADQRRRRGAIANGIEQNTLAILDETQDSQHTHDDSRFFGFCIFLLPSFDKSLKQSVIRPPASDLVWFNLIPFAWLSRGCLPRSSPCCLPERHPTNLVTLSLSVFVSVSLSLWLMLCILCNCKSKMLEAIFGILRMGKSLELIMSSFKLLIELEKVLRYSLLPYTFL